MTNRHAPPGRTSISYVVIRKPFGPHQFGTCFGSVHILNTSSRGASNTRLPTISRPDSVADELLSSSLVAAFILLLLLLQFAEVILEAIEAALPEFAVVADPFVDGLQRPGGEPAWPPLSVAAAGDEARALEHLQVLRDCGHAHVERL